MSLLPTQLSYFGEKKILSFALHTQPQPKITCRFPAFFFCVGGGGIGWLVGGDGCADGAFFFSSGNVYPESIQRPCRESRIRAIILDKIASDSSSSSKTKDEDPQIFRVSSE